MADDDDIHDMKDFPAQGFMDIIASLMLRLGEPGEVHSFFPEELHKEMRAKRLNLSIQIKAEEERVDIKVISQDEADVMIAQATNAIQ